MKLLPKGLFKLKGFRHLINMGYIYNTNSINKIGAGNANSITPVKGNGLTCNTTRHMV